MNVEKVLSARAKFKEIAKDLDDTNTSNASWVKREKYTDALEDLAFAVGIIERTNAFKTDVAGAVRKYTQVATEFNEGLDRYRDRAVAGNAVAQTKLNTLKHDLEMANIELDTAKDLLMIKYKELNKLSPLINKKLIPILPKSGGYRNTRAAKRKGRGSRRGRR